MSKHTPGPWEIEEDDYGDELWFGGEGRGIITVNGWSNGGCKRDPERWSNMQADARLIAAAPDLLKALRLVMSCAGEISTAPDGLLEMALDDGDEQTRQQANAFLVARAAIAKATGETNG